MFLPTGPSGRATNRRLSGCLRLAAAIILAPLLGVPASAQDFGDWTRAVSVDPGLVSGVNSLVTEGCPHEAPDGRTLFFASNRNPDAGPTATKDLDIWVAYRDSDDGPWGEPVPLPAPVNTGAAEFCPTPLPGNRLLFVSTRGTTCGGGNNPDIYYTRLKMHPVPHWTEPVPLPCEINSAYEEFSPSLVEAEGRTILYFSSNRESGIPAVHKIYSSELQADGTWTPAAKVEELSSDLSDARPNVRRDGLEIVFDSNRGPSGSFDIYTARRSSVTEVWSNVEPLGDAVNSPGTSETRASLSRDGRRLYFGSSRSNGGDIYVSTRTGQLGPPRKQPKEK